MKRLSLVILSIAVLGCLPARAVDVTDPSATVNVGVRSNIVDYRGSRALNLRLSAPFDRADRPTFARLTDIDFKDGTIEVDVAGTPGIWALMGARGFVGVAFRIQPDNQKFETFYIRPTNGRADDPSRRAHSVQYTSFPDWPWSRLRAEFPDKYETYVDLITGEWTHLKIVVAGQTARLYVHDAKVPTLVVDDLKLGADVSGAIGLWIGFGTDGHFRNLTVTPAA